MTLRDKLGTVATVLSVMGAVTAAALWLGKLTAAPEKLERHIVAESTRVAELDRHAEEQSDLLESLIRGECIENPAADLARQGLARKCRELGVTP